MSTQDDEQITNLQSQAEQQKTTPTFTEPEFFAVSPVKLVLMSICTFGLYEFFWFYRNWWYIKIREDSILLPLPRTIFSVIYCIPLFLRIKWDAESCSIAHSVLPRLMGAGWFALHLSPFLPAPYFLLTFLSSVILVPVQIAANKVNEHLRPGYDPNTKFTKWNITAVVVGGLFISFLLLGILFPIEEVPG